MINWQNKTLGEFVVLQRGHDLPTQNREVGKIPIMGSSGVTGFHSKPRVDGPGVTVGRSGASIGMVSYIEEDYWPLNTCLFVKDFKNNNRRFAYYLLQTLPLASFNSGSAQPSLNRNFIHPIKISVPSRGEQDQIAKLLGALDDKIENNRQMNETLEEMARAIFKSWFVDFDPVHAKAAGNAPVHMDADTAALFPNSFGEDGLPEGWRIRPVSDFAKIKGGKQLPKTRFVERGECPVFGGAGEMGRTDQCNAEGFVITVGRVGAYCGQFFSHRGNAWVNNNASQITPFNDVSGEWLITALRALDLEPIKKGAAQPFVSNSDIAALPIVYPSEQVLKVFAELVPHFQLKIEANQTESATLSSLRDTLLPKLMSGEIRLKGAEREVEAAV